MNKKQHGGKRTGAGRKKMKFIEKKIRITVWPLGESIKKAGGKRRAKLLALKAIEEC